jgi:hypothetical protein
VGEYLMPRGKPVRTDRARERFLETLRLSCNVSAAARAAGIGRATAYQWRESDPEFAAQWKDAEDEAVDNLEQVAWERATDGGSDRMMEILLKGHRPEKYAKTVIAGDRENPLTHEHRVDLSGAPEEVIRYLAGQKLPNEGS